MKGSDKRTQDPPESWLPSRCTVRLVAGSLRLPGRDPAELALLGFASGQTTDCRAYPTSLRLPPVYSRMLVTPAHSFPLCPCSRSAPCLPVAPQHSPTSWLFEKSRRLREVGKLKL